MKNLRELFPDFNFDSNNNEIFQNACQSAVVD